MMKTMIAATEYVKNWKVIVIALSVVVVLVTTYLLILPALSLDEETAAAQGGMDVSVSEEAEDMQEPEDVVVEAEEADADDVNADDVNADDADVAEADDAAVTENPDAATEPETAKAAKEASISDGGKTYDVTVTYGEEAGVPEDASLEVTEITSKSSQYGRLMSGTEDALGEDAVLAFARFFDIKIVDANGDKVEIAAPVDVKIELTDRNGNSEYSKNAQVVHFADGAKKGDVIEGVGVEGAAVSFLAEGFSAYAIVDGPDGDIPIGWHKVTKIEELTAQSVYIGHTSGFYFMNTTTGDASRMGIAKTKPATAQPDTGKAALYTFEKKEGSNNQFYIYCKDADGNKQYVYNGGNNSLSFKDESSRTAFTVEVDNNGVFKLHNGSWYWNMQGGANGVRFCSYNNASDVNNNMALWYYEEEQEDPYDLDGKTYGLMNWNGGAKGKAMMAEEGSAGCLNAKELTVLTKTGDESNKGKLFVPKNSDDKITMWTFRWVNENNYHLTAVSDEGQVYLKVDGKGKLSITGSAEDASLIQVIPGTGNRAGQICLKAAGGKTITYSGKIEKGFNTGGSTGTEWLYLAVESEYTEDYFMPYSAKKVSASDPSLETGSKIIIYTRAWNEAEKKYEFFVVEHDGSLVPCYESGDSIEWVGGLLNTKLWQFTEYEDGGKPNGYYEFYNQYSEKFLAPQITDGQILSSDPIGINLNGRTGGKYFTTILAWDDPQYSFAGLKVGGDHIESCKKGQAMDFYFATVENVPADDKLHEVPTIDNTQHGIKMKIQDFGTREEMSKFLGNNDGGAVQSTVPALLSTNLGEDGYPTTNTARYPKATPGSLAGLFDNTKNVNHLFIESTYKASGYYEFDSTQNFASLKGEKEGNFTVYKELGSYDNGGNRPTLKHGQFFPFNDIEAGQFASVNGKNLYNAKAEPLDAKDPRRNELLYLIRNADCFYGVELEASFVQTPNGLDAWGHDIIYEFTGDDDFWLYVDGELVIDLGGIHSALPGSVNFRTGEVHVNGKNTTLKDLFYNNYKSRGHSDAEAEAYVADKFEKNKDGQWIFKANTTHTMRIFYMERGAGAANLHMRFNLASIKPGTVELSKKLAGVDHSESILAEFPYQIQYQIRNTKTGKVVDGPENLTDEVGRHSEATSTVLYKDTVTPVKYKDSLTVGGVKYNNVFMLRPDETAEIDFMTVVNSKDLGEDEVIEYKIVECGVNTDVYSGVSVNGEDVTGTSETGYQANRKDFGIDFAPTTGQTGRARVAYSNRVNPEALRTLTFTKKLFKEDGTTEIKPGDDSTRFPFRLYLGTEFDEDPALANMHTYHVKDPEGNYCGWAAGSGSDPGEFISLGKDNYEDLTDDEKEMSSFNTSIYGTVDYIPVGYTVEVRELLAGTQFRVQERPANIPDGYSFQKYRYSDDIAHHRAVDYRDDEGHFVGATAGVTDVTAAGKDPHVDICNLKGFGLRVNKKWSDQDYMSEREATYFAVFTKDQHDKLTLVDGTVRRMAYDANPKTQTLYWYFLRLPVSGVDFDDYVIREVTLTAAELHVDKEGVVTNYDTITPVPDEGTFTLSGKQKGESETSTFDYTVLYKQGKISDNSNVRVDTAANNRPGIELRKTDWNGKALKGAMFVLNRINEGGSSTEIGTFTSDDDGMITVAFLSNDTDYTLTEVETPKPYRGLEDAMTIRLHNGSVTVSGVQEKYYELDQEEGKTPKLTIKNPPYELQVVKKDQGSGEAMEGVHFALYQKKKVGDQDKYEVVKGYEDLATGENGVVPKLDNTLPAGSYELRETETPSSHEALTGYVYFTVSKTGVITLGEHPDGAELNEAQKSDGTISYELQILNPAMKQVSFTKIDDAGVPLAGAEFDLYEGENGKPGEKMVAGLTSDSEGMLKKNDQKEFTLASGTYYLVETKAPAGYEMKDKPVTIEIRRGVDTEDADFGTVKSMNGISYDEGTDLSRDGRGIKYQAAKNLYTLQITNSSGVELPNSGGMGTTLLYLLGGLMMLLAGGGLVAKRRGIL